MSLIANTIRSLLKVLVYKSFARRTGIDNPLANKPTKHITECKIPVMIEDDSLCELKAYHSTVRGFWIKLQHTFCNITKIWCLFFSFWQDIADFHYQYGQKWKILTQTMKAKLFIYRKWMILLIWSWSKFFIFDHANSENLRYLAKTKKRCAKFFICCKIHENVSENH